VFNAIGEPELPAATHAAAERFRARCTVKFLNRPDRVARTSRPRLPGLLADIADVVVPTARRWHVGEAPSIDLPLLVRPVGSHGGVGLASVASEAEFVRATAGHAACDLTTFHDFASPDLLYRKYRMVFIDRRPLPYHLAIAEHWLVHYATAGMTDHPARRAEEKRFLDDPETAIGATAMAALSAIAARLDLDYAGIDFSILPDGRVLVFEANATMVVHPEAPDGVLAYKNPAVQAILAAFDAMALNPDAAARPSACSDRGPDGATSRRPAPGTAPRYPPAVPPAPAPSPAARSEMSARHSAATDMPPHRGEAASA
jgi:hypothetical protein